MTLEEVEQRAKQGDVEAMCSLGAYFFDGKTHEAKRLGEIWYEKAAKRNHPFAVYMTVRIKNINAYALLHATHNHRTAIDDWIEAYKWACRLIDLLNAETPGTEKIDRESAIQSYADATYFLAMCNFRLQNYQEAADLLQNIITEKRAKILFGEVLMDMADSDDEMYDAIRQFRFIDGDVEYATAVKGFLEGVEYTVSAITLSHSYREGWADSSAKPSIEKAIKLLNFVKLYLKDDGLKEVVDEELQHYKKNLFGRYSYVK